MSEHTKGRLSAVWEGFGSEYDLEAEDGGTVAEDLDEFNARRLAACWNAFENVRTELVEAMIGTGAMQAASDSMSALPAAQSELAAARALLREFVESNCNISFDLQNKAQNWLDACDTLGSGHG